MRNRVRAFSTPSIVLLVAAAWLTGVGGAFASPTDQSVTYQLSPTHAGDMADAGLATPLTPAWSVSLPDAVSYPLIANGMVYVTAADQTVYALNQATGATVWSHAVGGTYPWSGLAYDRGQVFTVNNSGVLTAFGAVTGSTSWSEQLPGQYLFSAPPTAVDGIVYVGGAGTGGTLYAVRERDGNLLWTDSVENGDQSSPAVDDQSVYVSYACVQAYAFDRATGAPVWHHNGPCEGGGGKTAVVANGTLFTRDFTGNLMLSTSTGSVLGAFNSDPVPMFAGGVGFMLTGSTLKAIANFGQGTTSWSFTGDGHLDTAPLAVGNLVFMGSSLGELYALDAATGATSWSANVGTPINGPDEQNVAAPLTGLGAANGTLIVPAGTTLTAYRTAGAITTAPTNQVTPSIDGRPQSGETLAVDVGVWSKLPTGYSYQWQRCDGAGANCADVNGATGATIGLVDNDVGSTFRASVIATNGSGSSAPGTSAASGAVLEAPPTNQTAPTIAGTAQEGELLTADPGTWSHDPTSYEFQWRRCSVGPPVSCADIPGETDGTYLVAATDVGYELEVRVTATNAGGDSDPSDSAPTQPVLPAPPVNESPPTISGLPQEGEVLLADPGEWSGNPTTYGYQWFTCNSAGTSCPDIVGATAPSYRVRTEDVGRYIGVEVVATNAGGDSDPADSDAYGPVLPAAPVNLTPPTIGGTAQDGQTLTATQGTWRGGPTGYSFQWYTCAPGGIFLVCVDIPGATASTYRVATADVGRRLFVGVVATNIGGDSDEAISALTATVVVAPPTNQLPPTISGTAQRGQTLTAAPGSWTSNPNGYAYQWKRCTSAGTGCTNIDGATNASYGLVDADVGQRVLVQVVAANAGGLSAPALSSPTGVVLPALDSSFATLKTAVARDGTLRFWEQARNPGTFVGAATFKTPSHRRSSTYGRGSATAADLGTFVLVIEPGASARKALAAGRTLSVRVAVTFRSALGGSPTTNIRSLTVHGKHKK